MLQVNARQAVHQTCLRQVFKAVRSLPKLCFSAAVMKESDNAIIFTGYVLTGKARNFPFKQLKQNQPCVLLLIVHDEDTYSTCEQSTGKILITKDYVQLKNVYHERLPLVATLCSSLR